MQWRVVLGFGTIPPDALCVRLDEALPAGTHADSYGKVGWQEHHVTVEAETVVEAAIEADTVLRNAFRAVGVPYAPIAVSVTTTAGAERHAEYLSQGPPPAAPARPSRPERSMECRLNALEAEAFRTCRRLAELESALRQIAGASGSATGVDTPTLMSAADERESGRTSET
jgi:hypothetical protein